MDKKAKGFSILLITLLLMCLASNLVRANFEPAPLPAILITNNGQVSPSSALINRSGDIYTFTGNWSAYVLEVERSNIVINGTGFSIVGNGVGYGINLHGVCNVVVSNINVEKTSRGIYLENSSKVTIDSCRVTGCNNGIYLNTSKNNIISGNKLYFNFNGIYLDHSGSNVLKNNQIQPSDSYPLNSMAHSFGLNFMVTGESLADYMNDVDSTNLVNGESIIYWVGRQNAVVPLNSSYVALVNCRAIIAQNQQISKTQGFLVAWTTNSTVANNRSFGNFNGIQVLHSSDIMVSGNQIWENNGLDAGGDGINLMYSQFVTVLNNQVTGNWNGGITCTSSSKNQLIGNIVAENWHNGINLLSGSNFNIISQNHLTNHTTNSRGAVYIENSRNNTFTSNNLNDNGCWAIQLKGDQGNNVFYGNNFLHNSYYNTRSNPDALQVSTPGTANGNSWDNGSYGNYWSDYKGSGKYFINENNIDHYPLIDQVDINSIAPIPTTNIGPDTPSIKPILFVLGSIVYPTNGTVVDANMGGVSIYWQYPANSTFSWVGYSLNGGGNVTVTGKDHLYDIENDGDYTFTLYANDTAGNWTTPQTVTYHVHVIGDALREKPIAVVVIITLILTVIILFALAVLVAYRRHRKTTNQA